MVFSYERLKFFFESACMRSSNSVLLAFWFLVIGGENSQAILDKIQL